MHYLLYAPAQKDVDSTLLFVQTSLLVQNASTQPFHDNLRDFGGLEVKYIQVALYNIWLLNAPSDGGLLGGLSPSDW